MADPPAGLALRRSTGALTFAAAATVLSSTVDRPDVPRRVGDLGGLVGSTAWGLWVAALGLVVLRGPAGVPVTAGPVRDALPLPRPPVATARPGPAAPTTTGTPGQRSRT
jgi:hypothetical protein